MARFIQPVELPENEKKIVDDIRKKSRRVTKKGLSRAEIIRRSIRFAGPKLLSGEVPLIEGSEAVTIPPEKR